ncbi:phospholipase D [Trichocladium antarcticum]|uniref:Phospholipase D1 n=1 Tax=Trichocladium antarcticum TaxID=1450529 RepID=A0AAN6ZDH6_9PEZI|nr:phospholipase D [Trichocladium antarcticum]
METGQGRWGLWSAPKLRQCCGDFPPDEPLFQVPSCCMDSTTTGGTNNQVLNSLYLQAVSVACIPHYPARANEAFVRQCVCGSRRLQSNVQLLVRQGDTYRIPDSTSLSTNRPPAIRSSTSSLAYYPVPLDPSPKTWHRTAGTQTRVPTAPLNPEAPDGAPVGATRRIVPVGSSTCAWTSAACFASEDCYSLIIRHDRQLAMAEPTKPDNATMARRETTMSSGAISEMPTIPQAKVFGPATPLGSDEFDFATRPNSTRGQNVTENEPPDYLNGGHPHETISPITKPAPSPADTPGGSAPSSPAPGRGAVQLPHDDGIPEPGVTHSRTGSWDTRDALGKLRGTGFMAKLKEFAGPSGTQTPRTAAAPAELPSTASSPTARRQGSRVPRIMGEGSDDDADAEETADETVTGRDKGKQKKKRRIRRPRMESHSVPSTPQVSALGGETSSAYGRLSFLRRSTLPGDDDHGFSEGEGRDRLTKQRGARRGGHWRSRTGDEADEVDGPAGLRVGHHFRRLSALGGGMSDGDAMTPRRPFFGADRATTYGAQKWRQVKGALKLLRKKEEQFDFSKSAELMAELRAVTPAVLMLASMIQRDEHGNKRIPVLLEQLRLRITDSMPIPDKDSERHWIFTMELEYGSGPSQMKWTIKRTIKDILNLHWKYKLTLGNEGFPTLEQGARPKQPRFPLSAFPYLRGARGLDDHDEEDPNMDARADETADNTAGEGTAQEGTDAENRAPMHRKRSRMNYLAGRRKASGLGSTADLTQVLDAAAQRRKYVERQQRMLERYLQNMIRWLMFRPDSNRLCRFLELSALGVRLAAEGSYHGKECYLHIQSSQGLDFRRVLTPGKVIARHSRKWFLVRQSYIVCVESPENMNIYDVYLVDSKFQIVTKKAKDKRLLAPKGRQGDEDIEHLGMSSGRRFTDKLQGHHTLKILTSERKVKLFSPNQHLIAQFEESIGEMLGKTPWHLENRFGSFAPVRTGVYAQWLVDGRDYMWNVSRAISMAKDVVYIHDWWLSPELYMRRPACISQKWRLDRLLQRKASEGVKIFVIVYRNVEAAIPIDSEYTKFSLLNLHPNIFIQRSPHQFKKNQFFFAHHEKICIVDHDIAFLGGIDLCFGRWDCPQHPVVDDKPTGFEAQDSPKDAEHCQLFPGKDYSNPRVHDFFKLSEPYEEMYDRSRVPRMPWHDIGMQVVGQPARDLTRHFVQRWNYVRRGRKPTRPTPFLLPPPDCKPEELEAVGLNGTCEVQILRSASTWSLGISETEHSIQSAYVKMIDESEHFVYMENQFFVTSTETMNHRMTNGIGDALVRRIIRAHEQGEEWRAVILIPLMPGFQNEVNEQDGTSVRLILQCQYRSICRGEHSIFGRVRAAGVEPEDYIQFFSLRQWGKLGNGNLTTEQLYIHAKCIIVDDRIVLMGSANINERSMLGDRDSEVAAVVRDTDMLWSTMAGEPYLVGRFAHTLRLRLMREHLGLDVDEILEDERQADLDRDEQYTAEMDRIYNDEPELSPVAESSRRRKSSHVEPAPTLPSSPHSAHSFNYDAPVEDDRRRRRRTLSKGSKKSNRGGSGSEASVEKHKREVEGFGHDRWKMAQEEGLDQGRDSIIIDDREVLVCDVASEGRGTLESPKLAAPLRRASGVGSVNESGGYEGMPPMPSFDRRTTEQLGLPRANQLPPLPAVDDTDIGGPNGRPSPVSPNGLALDITPADIHRDCMLDPLNPSFYDDVWSRAAENNTRIYRRVFRCMPDSEATNWAEYKEFDAYNRRFKESQDEHRTSEDGEKLPVPAAGVLAQAAASVGIGAPAAAVVGNAMSEKAADPTADPAPDEKRALAEGMRDDGRQPETATHDWGTAIDSSHDNLPETETTSNSNNNNNNNNNNRNHLNPQPDNHRKERRPTFSTLEKPPTTGGSTASANNNNNNNNNNHPDAAHGNGNGNGVKPAGSQRRRRRATTRGSRRGGGGGGFSATEELLSRGESEELLALTQGPLVQFPYDWLAVEETNGNWLFQVDQVAPLAIYN